MRQRLQGSTTVLLCMSVLAACGGSPGGEPQPQRPGALSSGAVLEVEAATLGLKVLGLTRSFTITNTSDQPAIAIQVVTEGTWPQGTVMTSHCGDLAPGATCSIDIAPGGTPSAAPGDTQAAPVVLRIAGSNTDALELAVHVVDIGSVYQGGYVFAIDDSPLPTQSIGGKVLDLTGRMAPWLADNTDTAIIDTITATSSTDGQANTRKIVDHMEQRQPPVDPEHYPAGICDASNAGGHTDWYLPALCEFSYDFADPSRVAACGNRSSPAMQNVQSALLDVPQPIAQIGATSWWSSTERGFNPTANALHYIPNTDIWISHKTIVRGVACARVLTP